MRRAVGIIALSILLSVVVGYASQGFIGYKSVGFIFIMASALSSLFLSPVEVLVSAVFHAFFWNFIFIPPTWTVHISSPEDAIMFLTFFVLAFATGTLTSKIRSREVQLMTAQRIADSERLYQVLLNSISHELKTPLTSILGSATALQSLTKSSALQSEVLLKNIVSSSQRLNHLIENLLDVTRIDSGHLRLDLDWYDVDELVRATVAKNDDVLSGHPVEITVEPQLPLLKCDYFIVERALTNLLLNAHHYSEPNSKIKFTVRKEGSNIEFAICDEGVGVPESERTSIFEKFVRGKSARTGGSGLGLSIVKSVAEAHKGKAWVKSRHDGKLGSEFVMSLPYEEKSV